jgi:adenine-specific DNA-methyltransferase
MLKLISHSPKRAIKALIKQRPLRAEIDLFKTNLKKLRHQMSVTEAQPINESEEHLKNNIRDFLRDTFYKETHAINTKDLVIHLGKTTDTNVAVVVEAKRPSNINEMIMPDNANKKALHELILYYFDERQHNTELKHLVITDINQWYVFDANDFDKHIYRNSSLKKLYDTKQLDKKDNPFFYEEVAKLLAKSNEELPCTFFNLKQYDAIINSDAQTLDDELVALYTLLSPKHLLKQHTANDSNALNEPFYKELLHIMGLEEAKEGSKLVIRRKLQNRHAGSIIELAIDTINSEEVLRHVPNKLEFSETPEEQTFNIALELCITWINRILFLKLLEGQLVAYNSSSSKEHTNNGAEYQFLNSATIPDFDELFTLFHKVLAVTLTDRATLLKQKYARVPYLNSSLFDISELEDQTIKIKALNNKTELELINSTVLKDIKKKQLALPTLNYLLSFLNAYDFGSDGSGSSIREENKSIINASVLGTVFEKINGYKDGSVYTPSFITMYMCKQSIRLAVLQKFNDAKGWNLQSFDKLNEKIEDIKEANSIINSLKICDPAVGSGHFLVSALNELIAVKSELEILVDENGKRLKDTFIEVLEDELYITDDDSKLLKYNFLNPYSQRVQKTLFNEKRNLIENCLFGVDINPKSVLICRLRLWIELLKNAYYKEETKFIELETLPNIDINIKCGNSLISRFALDADLTKALKSIKYDIKAYRGFVNDYKNEKSKDVKRGLQQIIDKIKSDFKTEINKNSKEYRKLQELQYEFNLLAAPNIFNNDGVAEPQAEYGSAENNKKQKDRITTLQAEINKRTKEFDDIKNNKIYQHAFEWRFEFPEVLNDNGEFEGFDLIIGNPPYIGVREIKNESKIFYKTNYTSAIDQFDLYVLFIERAFQLLKPNSVFSYITPDKFLISRYGKGILDYLSKNSTVIRYWNLASKNVFPGVSVYPIVLVLRKQNNNSENIFDKKYFELYSEEKISNKNSIIDKIESVEKIEFDAWRPLSTSNEIVTGKNKVITNKCISRFHLNYIEKKSTTTYRESDSIKNKILIKKLCYNIEAALDTSSCIPINTTYIISTKNIVTLKYVLAILNSRLLSFYVREKHISTALNGGYIELRVFQVKALPIITIEKSQQNKLATLVDVIIALKAENKDTSKLEKQIDELVYALYELTPEEIKIIETT